MKKKRKLIRKTLNQPSIIGGWFFIIFYDSSAIYGKHNKCQNVIVIHYIQMEETNMAKSELMKLCDDLEKGCNKRLCDKNEVICAKNELQKYVGDDKNKYLKLKAQIKKYDMNKINILDYMIKLVSILAFALTIMHNLTGGATFWYEIYAIFSMILLLVLSIINVFFNRSERKIETWVRYIDVALEDMARDKAWV